MENRDNRGQHSPKKKFLPKDNFPKSPPKRSLPKGYVTAEKMKFQAEMLANSLRKNFRHISKRYKAAKIDCFRLYDWDSPDIRLVVDWYAGHIVVAEYERLQTGSEYLPYMADAAGAALNVPKENIHIKRRHTNTKEGPRYKRIGSTGNRFIVNEGDLRFWVNLDDFLDTGLYSDHRNTRQLIRKICAGKSFLNLFAYTGAFTCAAAAGRAKSTVTVDRSDNYINWAQDNLKLNSLSGSQHLFIQSDVNKFLLQAIKNQKSFDLVFVDPPSFYKEQISGVEFDINRDHPELLFKIYKILPPGGIMFFSTNHQRFEPRFESLAFKEIVEITPKTIPEDYRNKKVHRCWEMKK